MRAWARGELPWAERVAINRAMANGIATHAFMANRFLPATRGSGRRGFVNPALLATHVVLVSFTHLLDVEVYSCLACWRGMQLDCMHAGQNVSASVRHSCRPASVSISSIVPPKSCMVADSVCAVSAYHCMRAACRPQFDQCRLLAARPRHVSVTSDASGAQSAARAAAVACMLHWSV